MAGGTRENTAHHNSKGTTLYLQVLLELCVGWYLWYGRMCSVVGPALSQSRRSLRAMDCGWLAKPLFVKLKMQVEKAMADKDGPIALCLVRH